MEARRIKGFTGAIPTLDRALLQDNQAQEAANIFLTSGRLDAIPSPKAVQQITKNSPATIYRMFNDQFSYWLSWAEQVDVAESPVYVENNFRIAFGSPSFEPRQTDLTLASQSGDPMTYPSAWYVLGVNPPITAPSVTSVTGGTGTNVSRTYVYTFVTAWGEESAPSPAANTFSGLPDGTWNISIPDVAPSNTYNITATTYTGGQLRLTLNTVFGLRAKETITISGVATAVNASWRIDSIDTVNKYAFITMANPGAIGATGTATRNAPHNTTGMTKRVYRSVTNADGTNFYLVGTNIPAATTTFADNVTSIGEMLATTGWVMPPADLQGLVVHPSGVVVGFRGNEVYLSEPYAIYAYKKANVQVLDYPIVGLSVFGQSVLIGTKGKPYLLSFVSPETAAPQKLEQNWPCLSKLGMVAMNGGVYYPTTVGLAFIGTAGTTLVTSKYYSQQDWQLVNPTTFIAGMYDNRYYAINTINSVSQVLVVSDTEGVSTINSSFSAIYTDRATGTLYTAKDNFIYQMYADNNRLLEYSWTSKEFVTADPVSLGAVKVDFSTTVDPTLLASIQAQNNTIKASNAALSGVFDGTVGYNEVNAHEVNYTGYTDLLPTDTLYYSTFTLLVNNVEVYQTVVPATVFRLPAIGKYDHYAVRMSGTAPVSSVVIGETPLSLKGV